MRAQIEVVAAEQHGVGVAEVAGEGLAIAPPAESREEADGARENPPGEPATRRAGGLEAGELEPRGIEGVQDLGKQQGLAEVRRRLVVVVLGREPADVAGDTAAEQEAEAPAEAVDAPAEESSE